MSTLSGFHKKRSSFLFSNVARCGRLGRFQLSHTSVCDHTSLVPRAVVRTGYVVLCVSVSRVRVCARVCVRIIRVLFGGSSRLASTSPRLSLTSPPSLPRPWRYPPSHRSHRLHSPSSRSLRSSLSRLSPPLPRSLAPCPDSVASPNPRCQSVSHRSRSIAVSVARPRTWPETSRSHRPRRSSRASRSDDDDASAFPQSPIIRTSTSDAINQNHPRAAPTARSRPS